MKYQFQSMSESDFLIYLKLTMKLIVNSHYTHSSLIFVFGKFPKKYKSTFFFKTSKFSLRKMYYFPHKINGNVKDFP